MAFYNGWKKHHGLKYQSIDLPNGMNFHIYGPASLRYNDLTTLGKSNILNPLSDYQDQIQIPIKTYGDKAYQYEMHRNIGSAIPDAHGLFHEFNLTMSALRQSIEWNFGQLNFYSNI
jgi:hypothetical protein